MFDEAANPRKCESGTRGCLSCFFFIFQMEFQAFPLCFMYLLHNHIQVIACLNVMWDLEGEVDNANFILNDFPLLISYLLHYMISGLGCRADPDG